jgi:hypothetical protein
MNVNEHEHMNSDNENQDHFKYEGNGFASLADSLLSQLHKHGIYLQDRETEIIKASLGEQEKRMYRRIEEKDEFISQLKQNVYELTEKRLRAIGSVSNGGENENGPAISDETASLISNNMQLLLVERETQIHLLNEELAHRQAEIERLKITIKEQDSVILSHNNNMAVSEKVFQLMIYLLNVFFFIY